MPVCIPEKVEVSVREGTITAKGPNGELAFRYHPSVEVVLDGTRLTFAPKHRTKQADALAGTTRAIAANMVTGVAKGFERRLTVIGVGYRAQVRGRELVLNVGFSHPVHYRIPDGIGIETPSQTEIVVKGADKQRVGQVAAEIRGFRPPEPYKGKGIRYADEHVARKQAKKK